MAIHTSCHHVCVVLLVLLVLVHCCSAHFYFLIRLPNSDKVPCVTGHECPSSNRICGGFGHTDCLSGDKSKFGKAFEHTGKLSWNSALCMLDTDGDGYTNGDELGDPCCRWNYGDTPDYTTDITNPDVRDSHPTRASCALGPLPSTPQFRAVPSSAIGSTRVQLAWLVPPTTCTCSFVLSVSAGATVLYSVSNIRSPSNDSVVTYVACGLNPATEYTFSLSGMNMRGGSAVADSVTITTASAADPNAAAADAKLCSPRTLVIPPAGTITVPTPFPFHTVAIVGFIVLFLVTGFVVNLRLSDTKYGASIRFWSLHRPIHRSRGDGGFLWSTVSWILRMTYVQLFFTILFLVVCGAVFIWAYDLLGAYIYPFGMRARILRSLGYMLYVPFIFAFVPITKYSVWIHLVGIPFERGVKYHRWIGAFGFVLMLVHGIGMDIELAKSALGPSYIFFFSMIVRHPFPGLLGGVFLTIALLGAYEPLRRKYRGFFKITHYFSFVSIVFIVVHIHYFYILAPTIIAYMVDVLYLFYDGFFRRTVVIASSIVAGKSTHEQYISLRLQKERFHCSPGQYVYLMVPSISLISHPFSIVSSEIQEISGAAEIFLLIKSMGPKSWTGKLAALVAAEQLPLGRWVFCYGPIGRPSVNLEECDECILFAGGIGVTPLVSMFKSCCSTLRSAGMEGSGIRLRSVTFVFSFRDVALWEQVREVITPCLADIPAGKITILLYETDGPRLGVSSGLHDDADVDDDDGKAPLQLTDFNTLSAAGGDAEMKEDIVHLQSLKVHSGRPPIREILLRESEELEGGNDTRRGCVGISVCGPQPMIDDVECSAFELNLLASASGTRYLVHSETFFL